MVKLNKKSTRTAVSQIKKMEKGLLRIPTGYLVLFVLAWLILREILGKAFVWKSGFIAGGAELLLMFTGLVLIRTKLMQRAFLYHLYITLLYLPIVFCLMDASSRIILWLFRSRGSFTVVFEIIILIFGFLLQIRKQIDNLKLAGHRNVKSGMLNMETGEWDLTVPIKLGTIEMEKSTQRLLKRLGYIAPFAPFIGMMINRTMSQNIVFEVLAYGMFFLAVSYGWGIARQPAIAFQLLDWEKKIGREITLLREDTD